jgi:predicted nucleotidyltransferase
MSQIADALFSRSTRAVLAAVFLHPQGIHLRALVVMTGLGSASAQRELGRLAQAGILQKEEIGRTLVYKPNKASPVYAELRSLIAKTAGIAPQLADLLAPFASKIERAFIYGSLARSEEDANSDIDLMVIAPSIGSADLYPALLQAEKTFHRKISLKVYRPLEFRKKLAEANHFLASVMASPKIYLIGGDDGHEGTRQSRKGGSTQA